MLDDPRVRRAVDWITTYRRFDDAEGEALTGWPYEPWEMCWGRHTCHMGTVKALKALAEAPPERHTPAVRGVPGGCHDANIGDRRRRHVLDPNTPTTGRTTLFVEVEVRDHEVGEWAAWR